MRGKRARAERRRKDEPSPDSQRSANSEAAASSPVVILETISCPAALWADLHNLVDHLPAGQAGALAERCRVVRSRAIYQAAADAGVPSDGPDRKSTRLNSSHIPLSR